MIKWLLTTTAVLSFFGLALFSSNAGTNSGTKDVSSVGLVARPAVALTAPMPTPASSPAYPLKMSANHRYFVDQNNAPTLVIGDAPQSLIVKLTPTQQESYFSDRQTKSFNAVWINLLCSTNTGGNANGKTDGGIAPFTSGNSPADYDLSTPNSTYFTAVDTVLSNSASHGLMVFLDPIETIDWLTTLRTNGGTKAFNYGVFLGNRYKNVPNIIWFHGNDFARYTDSTDNGLVGQVMAGIASVDPNHLQTILLFDEFNFPPYMVHSNMDSALSSYYGANAAYTYAPVYDAVLNAYSSSPITPVIMAESYYEFEDNGNWISAAPGVADAYVLRTISWFTLTSGGIGGYIYGNHYTWLSTWPPDQANRLDTPGANEIANINTLTNQINWWTLAPDTSHAIITSGYGTYTNVTTDPRTTNYCTTGYSSNLSLTYCPKSTTLTAAMSQFTGPVTARWYDPSNGTFTSISGSPFANTGSHNFATPGNNADGNPDWVLLLQAPSTTVSVSLPNVLASPGSVVTVPVTVDDLTGLGVRAYDLQVSFNPAILQPQATPFDTSGTLSSGMSITPNSANSGHLIISGFQSTDLSGSGTLLKLKFNVIGTAGQTSALTFENYTDPNTVFHPGFRFNAGSPAASTTSGSVTVNTPPTINASPVTRQAGSPVSNSTIATVSDVESGAAGVTVTVNSGASATVNGVTVSNIVNTAGTVTADVVATCAATNASFTLTATDGNGATSTATLNVTVNPNTSPALTYNPASVPVAGSTTVNPATGPSDNGSITSIVIQSAGTYTGTVSVSGAGVISISNATPFGSHTITIRATDNCGAITDATLSLSVTDNVPPETTIDSTPPNPSGSSSPTFQFSGTDSGSGVASFQCKLDAGAFAACTSPKSYTTLTDGSHTFQVKAIDVAGNPDPTPASYTWLVDTTGPATSIDSSPSNPTNSTSATFLFSATDAGSGVAGFECKLDAATFAACTSPTNFSGLSAGSHTFQVRAKDAVNNTGAAQSFTWSINGPPTIGAAAVTRQAGSASSNSTIATVNDVESGAGGVTVTVNGTSSATVNGVTVSGIVNTAGTVTANVVAACGATTAGFTLTATDGGGATATATLTVTVNANTAPTLVYSSPQSVIFGGSLNVTPTTATDNGSITGYSVQSVVPALNTAPTVDSSGTVSITNAQPAGSHVLTIRATDNCGATTDAQFTLNVGGVPSFTIDDVSHAEGNSSTTSFTFTITKSGSTAVTSTVDYATVNGTATAPGDYTAITTTTLTFLPADTTKQVTVLVNGDTTVEPDETFTVHLSNATTATIADADGVGTIVNDDQPSISGHIAYADAVTSAKNVTMTLTAPSFTTRTTTTDLNGNYTFAGVPAGNTYTLTPTKTGDINGLESLDASDVARYVAGLTLPSTNQRIAADADGDANLTSFDASLIARFVVGLPDAGIVGTWKFAPASLNYPGLNSDQTNQNFTAILVGDTGQDWNPAAAQSDGNTGANAPLPAISESSSSVSAGLLPTQTVPVSLPNETVFTGSTVTIPINVSNLSGLGVRAYDIQISFDPTVIQPQAVPFDKSGTLSGGMVVTTNANNPGHLIISGFQPTEVSGTGILLQLKFNVIGAPGQTTPLIFENYTDPNSLPHPIFHFNTGAPAANITNGSVAVVTSTQIGDITGRISDNNGNGVEGVSVRLTGTQNRLIMTDAQGNYRFDNVDTSGSYSVTPARANFDFTPAQRSFAPTGLHTEATFTASANGAGLNPLDTTEYFVRQQYLDFLNREPDESGLNFWVNTIESCGGDAACREVKRINNSGAFFLSIEFQETGYLVYRTYQAAYGEQPGVPVPVQLTEFKPDTQEIGNGVIVLQDGWQQKLENNKQAYMADFVSRPRFTLAYPTTMTPSDFVNQLFARAGVVPSPADLNTAINEFGGAGNSADPAARARALRDVADNAALSAQQFNQAFVLMQYFGYLRRDPNAAPDSDFGGYNFWLGKLNAFNGNYIDAEMVKAFISATEYRGRFH